MESVVIAIAARSGSRLLAFDLIGRPFSGSIGRCYGVKAIWDYGVSVRGIRCVVLIYNTSSRHPCAGVMTRSVWRGYIACFADIFFAAPCRVPAGSARRFAPREGFQKLHVMIMGKLNNQSCGWEVCIA